jgi:hypothetical protein
MDRLTSFTHRTRSAESKETYKAVENQQGMICWQPSYSTVFQHLPQPICVYSPSFLNRTADMPSNKLTYIITLHKPQSRTQTYM